MIRITIPEIHSYFQLQVDEGTLVLDVLELIQDQTNTNKNIKYWTCFSFTQQKVLNHQDTIQTYQNEELYVYFEFKNNFSEIYEQRDLEQNQVTSNSNVSTDRHSVRQSLDIKTLEQSYIIDKKTIVLDGIKHYIEMDGETSVKELLEFLAKENKIDQKKIFNWSCFSETRNKQLNLEEKIGFTKNEIFQIKTNKLQHTQSSRNINSQKVDLFENILYNQSIYESPEFKQCSKTITLIILVHDNSCIRRLTAMFDIYEKIEKIAEEVLRFCSLTKDYVSVDIFINDKQFNNPDKRGLTIQEANLNRDSKMIAKIRWID
ncbi:unnamed protein product (macronuclear) [Paramecium tetraurelia]|uniref:Ubiquitin-like domain-containing protein n=1 Tax=Paramecium tetraurelia TaxID=5888 RepID=A0DD31_PARTE|nr:uncharacterized protein GSPATT00015807001 [Paramecium tetraurelia]CAK80948.1 unnamed protein product [Paramecium tetraurelia]|eukprot:XP_001448345.1 hypothetical protein (macronuclear) [Paramecium tetraurelia strain d4-2]